MTPDVAGYTGTQDLKSAGFSTDDPVYIAASKVFAQSPKPSMVMVAVQKTTSGSTEKVDVTLDRAKAVPGWYCICPAGIKEDFYQSIADWTESNEKFCVCETTGISASPVSDAMFRTAVVHATKENDCVNPYRVAGIEMQIGAYVEQLDPLWKASLVDDDHWHYDVFSCKSGEKQVGSISSDYAQTGSFDLNDKATWSWHYIRKLGKLGAEAMMYEKFNGSGSTYVRAAFVSPGSAGVYAPWRGGALNGGAACGLPCAYGYYSPAHSYWSGVPRLAGSGKKRG